MVEWAALEMRCTGNGTGGSNPSFSATTINKPLSINRLQRFLFWGVHLGGQFPADNSNGGCVQEGLRM